MVRKISFSPPRQAHHLIPIFFLWFSSRSFRIVFYFLFFFFGLLSLFFVGVSFAHGCCRVTEIEELVSVGNRLLTGFQQALGNLKFMLASGWCFLLLLIFLVWRFWCFFIEFLRRPPIDKTSELVKSVLKANVTKRIQSYLEAGCINTHDGVQNTSNCECNCLFFFLDGLTLLK